MFRNMVLASVAAMGLLGIGAGTSEALPGVQLYEVQYRQGYWKEKVFFNPVQASLFEQNRVNKGYQTMRVIYGTQIRVRYMMPLWHTYQAVPGHLQAHQLERNLETRGFDARVVHRY